MKRLQLPKNKLARLVINVLLVAVWIIIWALIYDHFAFWSTANAFLLSFVPYVMGSYIITRYVWFGRLRPKTKITSSMDD
tara:strand:- start:382 stop:621 length:240 start_codon:yes stop_codon:yes gene_type:complete